MLRMLYTIGGVETDISRYVDWTSVSITESINVPAQLSFTANNYDPGFPTPVQRAYVRLYSTRFNRSLFTGFISSQPNVVFMALRAPGVQLFAYQMLCTSDEHLLNIKAVPFIPAFVNQTQGAVLAGIADILCPGFYDTSMVGSGDIEPYFQYDPNQSWCELAKTFGDGSRYRYKVRDKQIVFQPYGDGPLGIEYDESKTDKTFDPTSSGMSTQVLAVPTVNDITIIGAAEAGNNREDYFIGDGFTGNFPLRHKVFKGSSVLLLTDDWTEAQFNTQQWGTSDPGEQFNLGAGALNIVSSFALPLGQAYIQMNNALELAGGIDLEHGEFGWNDYSSGIIGGLYTQALYSTQPYAPSGCLGGFYISSPTGVITSASGAAGVYMQPTWEGQPVGPPIVSEVNHTYVLQTVITAPTYVRYNRFYRSLGGNSYGGVETAVTGDVTFIVQDYNIAAATGFYYLPNITKVSVSAVNLPAFCAYGLVNNNQLNLTVSYTTLALMPLGSLSAYEGPLGLWQPTGLILPMLPPGSGGYIGPVAPWPAGASGNIWLPPLMRNTAPHQEVLGNGFELQTAQVTQGNEADTLAFYAQTLPAAGTPIRFHSFESQAAISRLQASGSIAQEAYIVGDDGIRSAIIANLNPLPRTSEDCDAAAQAYLDDRTHVFYNGTYNCTSYFFNGLTSDTQFWPTCGRYLYVNSPARGIAEQWMLVTQLTIKVLDAVGNPQQTLSGLGQVGEVLEFSIGFGADLHLEKVLFNFADVQPTNVLTPTDTATPPIPMFSYQVDNAYQPDLSSIQVNPITDTAAQVTVYDTLVAPIEIRLEDANWGQGATPDYVGTVTTPTFSLVRQQFEQIWYMRFVDSTNGTYSRRSKVVRIYYPVTPLPPTLLSADSNFLQFDFNGDIRNVYGFELRAAEAIIGILGYTDGSEIGFPVGQAIYGPVASVFKGQWTVAAYNVGDVVCDGGIVYIVLLPGAGGLIPRLNPTYYGVVAQTGPVYGTPVPIVQKPCESIGDLLIDLTQTINTYPFSANRQFYAYFFNHQWSYSGPTSVNVPPPNLTIEEGYRFGQSLNLLCTLPAGRTDIAAQIWQIAADSAFKEIIIDQTNYTPGSQTFNIPATTTPAVDVSSEPAETDVTATGVQILSLWLCQPPVTTVINGIPFSATSPVLGFPSVTGTTATLTGTFTGKNSYAAFAPCTASTDLYYSVDSGATWTLWDNWTSEGAFSLDFSISVSGISNLNSIQLKVVATVTPEEPYSGGADAVISSAGTLTNVVASTIGLTSGDLYARSLLIDYISSGSWSPTVHIPLANLIASDYLSSQGSAPPILTNATGALGTYLSSASVIEVDTTSFGVLYPNGQTWTIPASVQYFSATKDTHTALSPGTAYYFYLSMPSAAYSNPTVLVDGPYQNPSQSALSYTVSDGRVQLSGGALVFYTASPTGHATGGGGGTSGGGAYCGVLSAMVLMADGSQKALRDTQVGDLVDDGCGGSERIVARQIVKDQVVRLVCAGTHKTRVADGHTLKMEYGWDSVVHMEEDHERGIEFPTVDTVDGMRRITSMHRYGLEDVCHLQLAGPKHTYVLDGFKTHNILVKTAV